MTFDYKTLFCYTISVIRNANYRVLDSRTKTYQFETIEEAFRDANRLMDSWNSPEGKNMPDVDAINTPFMRFAAENSIDSKVQE